MPSRSRVIPANAGRRSDAKVTESHVVHLADGPADVPVYDRATLGAGDHIEGPAVVTQLDATTLVRPGWTATVQPNGALLLTDANKKA